MINKDEEIKKWIFSGLKPFIFDGKYNFSETEMDSLIFLTIQETRQQEQKKYEKEIRAILKTVMKIINNRDFEKRDLIKKIKLLRYNNIKKPEK